MKLKKINAVLALLTTLFILVHIGYNTYCYLAYYYNPTLKIATSIPVMLSVCLHGILGMLAVFLMGDGTKLTTYPKQNIRTIIQRVSAALIFPLLILHLNTFNILKTSSEEGSWPKFILVIICQVLFYGIIIVHTAVSVTKALITLGLLSSPAKQKKLDKIIYFIAGFVLAIAAYSIIKGQLSMFWR